jgi:hypothetical protein
MSAPWGNPVVRIVRLKQPDKILTRHPDMDIYGQFRKSDRIEDRRGGFQPTAFPWFIERLDENPGPLSREAGLDDIDPKKKKRPKGLLD